MSSEASHAKSLEAFLAALAPILKAIHAVDLQDPDAACALLTEEFPMESESMQALKRQTRAGVSEGWLCTKEAGGVRFSRPKKPDANDNLSIDAVHMNGPGPGHAHPNGEVNLCFDVDSPTSNGVVDNTIGATFDGRPEGWTVYAPNSWHIPTVENGTMDILYFVPDGILKFGPQSA